jgi:hypothetical protein
MQNKRWQTRLDALLNPWNWLILLLVLGLLGITIFGLLLSAGRLNHFDMGSINMSLHPCRDPSNSHMLWIIYSGVVFILTSLFAVGELVSFIEARDRQYPAPRLRLLGRNALLWGIAALLMAVLTFYFILGSC